MAQQLTDWHRQTAAGIAAAHPLTPTTPIKATGQHRVAENDEPEPTIMDLAGEMQALANAIKAQRAPSLRHMIADIVAAPPVVFPRGYEKPCLLCGGTPSGESHRGFVGRCTCEVRT